MPNNPRDYDAMDPREIVQVSVRLDAGLMARVMRGCDETGLALREYVEMALYRSLSQDKLNDTQDAR